jgi:modulator of FtsH protease HflC
MVQILRGNRFALIGLILLALVGSSGIVMVREDQQVVIARMGVPDRVVNRFRPGSSDGAGIVPKIPLAETAMVFPRGLVGVRHDAKRIKSADGQWLLVDTEVTYRIIDPVKLASGLGDTAKADDQIKAQLPVLLDRELGQRRAADIVRPGAGGANAAILLGMNQKLRAYGLQVVDLRLAGARVDAAGQDQVFDRMRIRHEQVLYDVKLKSAGDAAAITQSAQIEAATRRKQSADKDPEFYSFFRAMRSYADMYGDPERKNTTTIVLPPDSGYLKHFGGK